ncbi:MAG: DUF721 domain-containing protein [Thermoleophilia bacterium]|nr:DUF721 domain-containing protein [Thermoleophilia bacterium]
MADRLGRFTRPGGAPEGAGITLLRERWPAVAGEEIARFSTPLRRSRAGVLTIACSDGTWAQELSARHDMLIDGLRREAPDIPLSRLRFSISESAARQPVVDDRPEPPPPPPGPAAKAAARRLVEGVEDERLREVLQRAAAQGLERRQS